MPTILNNEIEPQYEIHDYHYLLLMSIIFVIFAIFVITLLMLLYLLFHFDVHFINLLKYFLLLLFPLIFFTLK